MGEKVVVKPGTEGSAIGVFIVEGAEAIEDALLKALDIDDEVLIERYIKGREFTVAVLGNHEPKAMPVIEIVPKSDFYDFESKYAVGGSLASALRIPDDVTRKVCSARRKTLTKRSRAAVPLALTSFWKTTVIVGRWRRTPFPA